MAQNPNSITIHKLDPQGQEQWRYEGTLLNKNDAELTLEAFFDREDVTFHGIQLKRGDRFVETFYFDRWYNVFAIYDQNTGKLKGWYCNITRPAWLEGSHLFAEDLALDLIILPDLQITILDEDEFADLKLDEHDRANALSAMQELIKLAERGIGPFELTTT